MQRSSIERLFASSARLARLVLQSGAMMIRFPQGAMMRRAALLGALGLGASLVGCNSTQSKACHERMAEAQAVVTGVDSNSLDSVDRSIAAIQSAEATCTASGLSGELTELSKARERFASHRVLLVERDERKRAKVLSPEQLEKYVKSGDPNCPKGQAYQHKPSGKEIRCTGPRPAEMNATLAEAYFKSKGFRAMAGSSKTVLKMEKGSERYIFEYAAGSDAPTCLRVSPMPGIPWQEAVSKLTGTSPEKFKHGSTVSVLGQELTIDVAPNHENVNLGNCSK